MSKEQIEREYATVADESSNSLPPPLSAEDLFGASSSEDDSYSVPIDATLPRNAKMLDSPSKRPPQPSRPPPVHPANIDVGSDYRLLQPIEEKQKAAAAAATNSAASSSNKDSPRRDSAGYHMIDESKLRKMNGTHEYEYGTAKPVVPPRPSLTSRQGKTVSYLAVPQKSANRLSTAMYSDTQEYLTSLVSGKGSFSRPPRPATIYDALVNDLESDDDGDEDESTLKSDSVYLGEPPTPPPRKWQSVTGGGGTTHVMALLQNRGRRLPGSPPQADKPPVDHSYENKKAGEKSEFPSQMSFKKKSPVHGMKTVEVFSDVMEAGTNLDKSGYLSELRKFGRWKKRWIVLRGSEILFFGSMDDEMKGVAATTVIGISEYTKFQVIPGELIGEPSKIFEIVDPQKSYRLMAESAKELEAWMHILLRVRAVVVAAQENAQPRLGAMLTKVRNGWSKQRWVVLVGRTLYYGKSPTHRPKGSIRLGNSAVTVEPGDPDSDLEEGMKEQLSIKVTTFNSGYYTFLMPDRDTFNKWLFFMQMASGKLSSDIGTETERILLSLYSDFKVDAPELDAPIFQFEEKLTAPLTTLISKELEGKAVEVAKSIELYTSVPIDSGAADYHLLLAQSIIEEGVKSCDFQNELYCQLIKRTTKHPEPDGQLHKQCWQLLVLMISIFLPSAFFLRYLELHLARSSNSKTESGKMALFGVRCLQRHLSNGGRLRAPSRAEIIAMVCRNPYDFAQPLSAPVTLATGSVMLAGFDSSTTFEEFARQISEDMGIRSPEESGFRVFCSAMGVSKDVIVSEKQGRKLCDMLYEWEKTALLSGKGHVSNLVPDFYFKRQLYFSDKDTPADHHTEEILLAFQLGQDIMSQRQYVNLPDAIKLGAILARLEYGPLDAETKKKVGSVVKSMIPAVLRNPSLKETTNPVTGTGSVRRKTMDIEKDFLLEWQTLSDPEMDTKELGKKYLSICKKWRLYGAYMVQADVVAKGSREQHVWIAVHEGGIEVLDQKSYNSLEEISFQSIKSFGGPMGHFRILYMAPNRGRQEIVFALANTAKHKETALTIAAYINAIVRIDGVTCVVASIEEAAQIMDETV